MTDKELKKLSRLELIDLLHQQAVRIEELERELSEAKSELISREVRLEESGSIAEAAMKIYYVFETAQRAADLYVENVKRQTNERYRGKTLNPVSEPTRRI